ncbi:MAG: GTPase Der [candidate division WS2 bacterium]|nr:GTPase Der [Candidatus Lithacetigena glycinireducens]
MHIPKVVIVGRTNVGKSTLFNHLAGKRISIEDKMPGVTRDYLEVLLKEGKRCVYLYDTGGYQPEVTDDLEEKVQLIGRNLLEDGDLIILVVDGREGITPIDEEIVQFIRVVGKPYLVVVNKVESLKYQDTAFYKLGEKVFFVSALENYGLGGLKKEIMKQGVVLESLQGKGLRVAIVGRPNVGKSTLFNSLLGYNRALVDDRPQTTRDSLEEEINTPEGLLRIVDTAGLRKRKSVSSSLEAYSIDRTVKAVESSEVVILMISGEEGVLQQDQTIAYLIEKSQKGVVIVLNKADLLQEGTQKTALAYIQEAFFKMQYAPIVFISANKKRGLKTLLKTVFKVGRNYYRRIKTHQVNVCLETFQLNTSLKIYYGTQAEVAPPTFVLSINKARLFREDDRNRLEKMFREQHDFSGVPIIIKTKE